MRPEIVNPCILEAVDINGVITPLATETLTRHCFYYIHIPEYNFSLFPSLSNKKIIRKRKKFEIFIELDITG